MQTANARGNKYENYSQSKYLNSAQAVGRITNILDQISPEVIKEFSLVAINADQSMFAVDIPRDQYQLYKTKKNDALLEAVTIYQPDPKQQLTHDYRPQTKLPTTIWKLSPAIRSQIGGPDGFYFGDFSIAFHARLYYEKISIF